MSIEPGTRFAHYEIVGLLGAGGMGEVYRARDGKLHREVAIKLLPRELSGDPERLARFEREARTLASLQHPNIASIYGFESVDGIRFLVMELVEGEDLVARLARGTVATDECIEIALQIAQGLDAAHERGVVHRDLKPANLKLGPDGQVKILDFGLARAYAGSDDPDGDPAESPTITAAMTQAGTILGTAAYMSPEQARGRAVDKRADIWAFGVVLYEMLSGRRAFEGDTISDTLAAVLRAEPDRDELSAQLPRPLRTLLDRCLEKNPRRRLRDIGEAVVLLEDLKAGRINGESAGPQGVAATAARPIWYAAVIVALLLGAAGAWMLRPAAPEMQLQKLRVDVGTSQAYSPVVSPDGRHIAFFEEESLWVQSFDQLDARMLSESVISLFRPVWSPQSDQIAFMSNHQLLRVSRNGGAPILICGISSVGGGAGGHWTADGLMLFTLGSDHVYEVSALGGTPKIHLAVDESVDLDLHSPYLLPDGETLLVVRHSQRLGPSILSIYSDGEYYELDSVPPTLLWNPIYDPRGFVLVTRRGAATGVWAIPVSLDPPARTGEPFLVAADCGYPSLDRSGTLVYQRGAESSAAALVLIDREGTVQRQLTDYEDGFYAFAVSPDQRYAAIDVRGTAGNELWLHDLERGSRTRIISGSGSPTIPTWSHDGRTLFYSVRRRLTMRPVDGSSPERILGSGGHASPGPDGEHVVYSLIDASSSSNLYMRSLTDPSDSTLVLESPADNWDPYISPNGEYLLYSSDESGTREVYLSSFPVGRGRWQVSTQGGKMPQWSANGDKIYYMDDEGGFHEVDVTWGTEPRLSAPKKLFTLHQVGLQDWGDYFVRAASEADRFIAMKLSDEVRRTEIVMDRDWLREFRATR